MCHSKKYPYLPFDADDADDDDDDVMTTMMKSCPKFINY